MEHAEARELLEIAAVGPGGFARLIAGDPQEAAALAGHLAGCTACSEEMERLRRSAGVIRGAVRQMPSPDLRDRTLAYVAALGRPRSAASSPEAAAGVLVEAAPTGGPAPALHERDARGASRRPRLAVIGRPAWLASLAAAIVIAVVGTSFFVGAGRDRQIGEQAEEIDALRDVAAWTIRVDRQADARHVALAGAAGSTLTGTLIFSPSSTDVVVVAKGLATPAVGTEYRCWV